MKLLPVDIIIIILSFDNRFLIKNGKIINIKHISKNDFRYKLLLNIPPKKYFQDFVSKFTFVNIYVNYKKDFNIINRGYEIVLETIYYVPFINAVTCINSESILIE